MCIFNKNIYEIDNINMNKNFISLRIVKLNFIVLVYCNFDYKFGELLQEVSEHVSNLLIKYNGAKILNCRDFNASQKTLYSKKDFDFSGCTRYYRPDLVQDV